MILRMIAVIALFAVVDGYSQGLDGLKKEGLKEQGVNEPFPVKDKKKQLRWFVKWTAKDKIPMFYLPKFLAFLKEERDPWKKALDNEELREKPRKQYVRYYKSHVKWYGDIIECVDTMLASKMGIMSVEGNPEPVYVKKRKALELKIKEALVKFRGTASKRPKIAKKGK